MRYCYLSFLLLAILLQTQDRAFGPKDKIVDFKLSYTAFNALAAFDSSCLCPFSSFRRQLACISLEWLILLYGVVTVIVRVDDADYHLLPRWTELSSFLTSVLQARKDSFLLLRLHLPMRDKAVHQQEC